MIEQTSQSAISPRDLAKRWGISYKNVLTQIQKGEIPYFTVGWMKRIPLDWVERKEQQGDQAVTQKPGKGKKK